MGQPTTSPQFYLGYRPALDGVRAVAILIVMVYHANPAALRGGFLGVDLFFVLSGFLITTLLVQEIHLTGSLHLLHFYKRRLLRLFPALVFLIVVYLAISALNFSVFSHALLRAAVVLGYVANWVLAFDVLHLNLITHTWSLAIEEQFYIGFPILMLFLVPRLEWHQVRTILLAAIGSVSLLRVLLWFSGAEWYRIYYGMDTRADALLWGCWLGVTLSTSTTWRTSFWARWARLALFPALVLFCLFLATTSVGNTVHAIWVFPLVALIATILLFQLVVVPQGRLHALFEVPLLVRIGKISYGLYLWHYPIYTVLIWMGLSGVLVFLIGTPLTFGIALFSYYVIERPFLRRRERVVALSPADADSQSPSMLTVPTIER